MEFKPPCQCTMIFHSSSIVFQSYSTTVLQLRKSPSYIETIAIMACHGRRPSSGLCSARRGWQGRSGVSCPMQFQQVKWGLEVATKLISIVKSVQSCIMCWNSSVGRNRGMSWGSLVQILVWKLKQNCIQPMTPSIASLGLKFSRSLASLSSNSQWSERSWHRCLQVGRDIKCWWYCTLMWFNRDY